MSAVAAKNDVITLTVLESATIFDGPDTVYRYDLPASGIVSGWAVPAVVDQVRQLCTSCWPDVEIIVDGNDQVTEMVTKTFLAKGVPCYPVDVLREKPLPELDGPGETIDIVRPTKGRRHRRLTIAPLHIGVSVVVVVVAVVAFVIAGGNPTPEPRGSSSGTTSRAAPTTSSQAPAMSTTTTAAEEPPVLPEVVQMNGVELTAPPGTVPSSDGDDLWLHLPDPDQRILVWHQPAADHRDVLSDVAAWVTTDPELSLQGDRALRDTVPAIHYLERSGDGAETYWTTWLSEGRQVSVGCQTRQGRTPEQADVCTAVVESARVVS